MDYINYLYAIAPELPTSDSPSDPKEPIKMTPSEPTTGDSPLMPAPSPAPTEPAPAPLDPTPVTETPSYLEPAPEEPTQVINISYDQTPPIGEIVDSINTGGVFGGGGGGGGGFGMPSEEGGEAEPPKKTFVPLILIAVGAFLLIKRK